MSALSHAWRWLCAHTRRQRRADSRASARSAIARTSHQQRMARARVGAAYVRHAEIDRALREQHLLLRQAREQILRAVAVAEHAADGARAEAGAAAAAPYLQTAAGLQAQLGVVDAALVQLDQLHGQALGDVTRARQLLHDTGTSLDDALRQQVSLLARLERLERERVIAEQMLRKREQDRPG